MTESIMSQLDNIPDSSGPIGECRYNCSEAEHVGNHKYVCLYSSHWDDDPADTVGVWQ